MYYKLDYAKRCRAIVLSTPTAVKSLALKFVEICHILDNGEAMKEEASATLARGVTSFLKTLGFFKKKDNSAELNKLPDKLVDCTPHQLRLKGELCARMFKLMEEGVLLLDEVDMILHPLVGAGRGLLGGWVGG